MLSNRICSHLFNTKTKYYHFTEFPFVYITELTGAKQYKSRKVDLCFNYLKHAFKYVKARI